MDSKPNPDSNSKPNPAESFKLGKGQHRPQPLNLRQKRVVAEYLRTGKKGASYAAVYKAKNSVDAGRRANGFFRKPKIQDALQKALKDSKFDDQYAVETLKKIVDGGMQNIDITRPDTSLKALETYFKITNKMGGGNKVAIKLDIEAQAKKMDIGELKASLKELDKRQKRLMEIIKGTAVEEGELIK